MMCPYCEDSGVDLTTAQPCKHCLMGLQLESMLGGVLLLFTVPTPRLLAYEAAMNPSVN